LKSSACKNYHFVFNVETYSIEARDMRFVNTIPSFPHESRLSPAILQKFEIFILI